MKKSSIGRAWEREQIRSLLSFIDARSAEDEQSFAEILNAATSGSFGLTATKIAANFEIDRSTVARWANGETKPKRFVRSHIVDYIVSELGENLKKVSALPRKTRAVGVKRQAARYAI